MAKKRCAECWNGEIDSTGMPTVLILARDPETKKIYRRERVCEDHYGMLRDDGWEIRKLSGWEN